MKKAVFVLVLMIFILSSAAAETVLFCINDNRQQIEQTPWSQTVLRAFEDGFMDVLFEEGHIVTSSFLNECKTLSEEGFVTNRDVARIMANRMGADSVLIVELKFPAPVSGVLPVPEGAEYSLYTDAGKVLADEFQKTFKIASERGEEELLSSFSRIGQDIASELISKLQ